ncbi:MAG TPA: HAMP domain-containing sensor histidine kinase [Bryobacteraceae bacterium]|nr:HAMP domain-containing sensor histidine kinase [Bryobacteraceae bacterium]
MRIAVISNDGSLLTLCHEVVARLSQPDCQVTAPQVAPDVSEADVFLWDWDLKPESPFLPGRLPGMDVFLVRRSELKQFLNRFPDAGAYTLLKPVSPAALEVFLSYLCRQRAGGECNSSGDDREMLRECLLDSMLRLQEFEEDRTNFWARAAHDFRAPLTAASGYCGLLLEEEYAPIDPNQRELLSRIQHSLKKLIRMSSAMLQLTTARQTERMIELKRTDMVDCINRSVDEIRFFASEKKLTLDIDLVKPDEPLYIEPGQIEQVLVNLLENACKFTPRNGSITVRGQTVSWPCGGQLAAVSNPAGSPSAKNLSGYRVDIFDTGPGISPEEAKTLFDESVAAGNTADRSGGGLGLAICKMILRAHHGEIWTETREKGTCFSFILPTNKSVMPRVVSGLRNAATDSGDSKFLAQ